MGTTFIIFGIFMLFILCVVANTNSETVDKKTSPPKKAHTIKETSYANYEPIYSFDFINPYDLPDCHTIASSNHKDKRIATYYLEKYSNVSSFSADNFSSYSCDDIGNSNSFLAIMENEHWIQEFEPAEIIDSLYTADEIKNILRKNKLKVGGRKRELVDRLLENVPFSELSDRYEHKKYRITKAGHNLVDEKKADYVQAVIDATHYAEKMEWDNVLKTYRSFDEKWGFIHSSGIRHTILATYDVPREQIPFLCSYHMNELFNSNKFKNDLRYFLAASRLRKPKKREELAREFRLINNEPINCPNIIDLFQAREDLPELRENEIVFVRRGMQEKIDREPDETLSYYISLLIYYSKQ